MSYPTRRDDYENYYEDNDAGYPQFSDVHEYPNVNKMVGDRPYKKNNNQYYDQQYAPKKNKNKYKKYPQQKDKPQMGAVPKPAYKPKRKIPKGPIYMDQTGQKYVAVPIGTPQLMPVAVPQYQVPVYPQPPMYAPQPPMYAPQSPMYAPQPQPYPYYPPQPQGPNTVLVVPPGYTRDYSANYSPFGDIMDDFYNL